MACLWLERFQKLVLWIAMGNSNARKQLIFSVCQIQAFQLSPSAASTCPLNRLGASFHKGKPCSTPFRPKGVCKASSRLGERSRQHIGESHDEIQI